MQTLTETSSPSLKDRICEERAREISKRQELASVAIKTLFPSLKDKTLTNTLVGIYEKKNG